MTMDDNTETMSWDLGSAGTLTATREIEMVRSMSPQPDPNWTYTDAASHKHTREGHSYPTLKRVVERTYWCESCRDEHEDTHLECAQCGEEIEPGTVPPNPYGERMVMGVSYTLNDEPISEERFKEIMVEQSRLATEREQKRRDGAVSRLEALVAGWQAKGLSAREIAEKIADGVLGVVIR